MRLPSSIFGKVRTVPGIRCVYCNRTSSKAVCAGCAKKKRPTRLRQWLKLHGAQVKDLAERARVSERSVRYAADGKPVGARVALALHGVTGIALADLLAGN